MTSAILVVGGLAIFSLALLGWSRGRAVDRAIERRVTEMTGRTP